VTHRLQKLQEIGALLPSLDESRILRTLAQELEARALLETNEYDVVLLDLRMPDLGGDTLYEELRDRDPRHARRVVFVTGNVQSDDARRFLDRAGRPVVGKPFQLDELATALAGVTT
jgi:CheY-like chemotaxis protein